MVARTASRRLVALGGSGMPGQYSLNPSAIRKVCALLLLSLSVDSRIDASWRQSVKPRYGRVRSHAPPEIPVCGAAPTGVPSGACDGRRRHDSQTVPQVKIGFTCQTI